MSQKKLALAYCKENSQLAAKITSDLQRANYQFEALTCSTTPEASSLTQKMQATDLSVILLISDNFLKSTSCMTRALSVYQDLDRQRRLLPIIIPGRVRNENGVWEEVSTSFERVSNVIQYMNFWQDKYLELRKQKRNIPAEEETDFNEKLRIVREISSEIGEFLRHVRSSVHYDYEALTAKDYEIVFRFTKDEVGYQQFKSSTPAMAIVEEVAKTAEVSQVANGNGTTFEAPAPVEENTENQSLVDLIQSSKDDLIRENDSPEAVAAPPVEVPENVVETTENVVETTENAIETQTDAATITPPPIVPPSLPTVETPTPNDELEEIMDQLPEIEPEATTQEEQIATLAEQEVLNTLAQEELDSEEPPVDLSSIPGMQEIEAAAAQVETPSEEEDTSFITDILEENNVGDTPEITAVDEPTNITPESDTPTALLDQIVDEAPVVSQQEAVSTDFDALVDEVMKEEAELAGQQDEVEITSSEATIALKDSLEETEPEAANEPMVTLTDIIDNQVVNSSEKQEEEGVINIPPAAAPAVNIIPWEEIALSARNMVQNKETEQALNTLKAGVDMHPNVTELRHFYALVLAKHTHHFKAATEQLEAILDQDDKHSDAYFLLAEIAEFNKDFIMAKSYYDKTISLEPDYPNAHYRTAIVLSAHFADQEEMAFEHFKKAAKQDKNNVDAHYQQGILLRDYFEKPEKAAKQFKKAIKLKADHPTAFYDLALSLHQANDREGAAWAYARAIEINPELQTPNNDEAFKIVEVAKPDTVAVSQQTDDKLAQLMQDIKRLETKISRITEAVEAKVATPTTLVDTPLELASNGVVQEVIEEEIVEEIPEPEEPEIKEPGKIAFITGATSGIGKATAELFAKEGYRLIMTGRRAARLEALQQDFEENYGTETQILDFDVRQVDKLVLAINQLPEEWRNIDILINNAGLAKGFSEIHEGDLTHWEQMIDTNIKGLLYMTRAIAPFMVERREGHIINICSTAGHEVYPKGNVYCATKHAVHALTQSMRIDLHKYNIRVSQVSPGHVEETEFAITRFDGDAEKAKIYEDFKPLSSPDVAELIYFIATRPAHVNIQDILVMGTQQASSNHVDRSGRA